MTNSFLALSDRTNTNKMRQESLNEFNKILQNEMYDLISETILGAIHLCNNYLINNNEFIKPG